MKNKFSDYILYREADEGQGVPVQTMNTSSTQVQADPKYPALSQQMPSSSTATQPTDPSMKEKLQDEHIKQTFANHINKAFEDLKKSNISPEKAKSILGIVVGEMMKATGLTQSQAKTVVSKIK